MRTWWMKRGVWLVNSVGDSADGGPGEAVDFGNFFGSGGAPKDDQDDGAVEEFDGDDNSEDQADEPIDDEDGDVDDGGDDGDSGDSGDDDAPADPTTIHLSAIAQQQKILEGLLKEKEKVQDAPVEIAPEVDPFESEEFTAMAEVMNWDSEETEAAKTFFRKFMDFGNKKAFEKFNQQIPGTIESTIQRNEQIKAARQSFYEANPMLSEVKPFVGQIAQLVAQELGEAATLEGVMKEAAKRAYKALGVDPKNIPRATKTKEKTAPAFPVKKGARKQVTKPPKLQQEIDAVIGA